MTPYEHLALTQTLRSLCFVTTGGLLVGLRRLPPGHPMIWGLMALLAAAWVMAAIEFRRVRRVAARIRSGDMPDDEFARESATLGSEIDRWINRWTLKGDPKPWWPVVGVLQGVAMGLLLCIPT